MRTPGDIKRRRSVKAEFDTGFAATAVGGGVLAEKGRGPRRLQVGADRLKGERSQRR